MPSISKSLFLTETRSYPLKGWAKSFFLVVFLWSTLPVVSLAQRFAYVDSDYILTHIPEYTSAQKQLDGTSEKWQKEVDTKLKEIDQLKKSLLADQVLLGEQARRARENDIQEKEKLLQDFQEAKFGYSGELFKLRTRLIKPLQERVAKAIQQIAENQALDVIFDKNSEVMLLYANPKYDKSNAVVLQLGYKP